MNWTDTIKFLNDMGVLPLVILLFAFPLGSLLTLALIRRLLLKDFSFKDAWKAWLADHHARTEIEIKLEARITDLVEEVKRLVVVNMDNRTFVEQVLAQTRSEHELIIRHLRDILIFQKMPIVDDDVKK